jgi:hypothetical protein
MFRRFFSSASRMCQECNYDYTHSYIVGAAAVSYITMLTITNHNTQCQQHKEIQKELQDMREEMELYKSL